MAIHLGSTGRNPSAAAVLRLTFDRRLTISTSTLPDSGQLRRDVWNYRSRAVPRRRGPMLLRMKMNDFALWFFIGWAKSP